MPYTTLIQATELQPRIGSPDWLVIDPRHALADPQAGRTAYAAGHLPGAVFLHLDEELSSLRTGHNGRHPLPAREVFVATLARLGVNATTQVIVHDAQDSAMAASRLWWMLRWVGHEAVAVLDGGVAAWLAAGGELTQTVPPARAPGDITLRASLAPTADADAVLANLRTQARLVVDARGADRFRGENETIDPVAGHIPGARNRPFKDNLLPNGRFKPAAQLREEYLALLQGTAPDAVIAQCGSGVTACHNLLAMEAAGLPGASLYPGSWSEWCSDPARPVAK